MYARQSRLGRLILVALLAATLHLGGSALGVAHAANGPGTQVTEGPDLLVNGGFERGIDPGASYVFPSGDSSSLIQGWTLLNAGLDKFWPGVTYIGSSMPCEEGKYCIELVNGGENPKNIGGVKEIFASVAGQKYHLRFYQSADVHQAGPRALKYTIAGQSGTYNYVPLPNEVQNPKAIRWIQRDVTFTASGAATTLEFDSALAQNGYGSLLDNVQLRAILPPAGAPTPSPAPTTSHGTGAHSGITLHLDSQSLHVGAQQRVSGVTQPNASVAVIVDFVYGVQAVASIRAGADGRFSYTFTIPAGVGGTNHVLVDCNGSAAQAAFTVIG